MRLRILFCQYEPGSDRIMPNAVAVTDEFMEDEHGGIPPYFEDERKKMDDSSTELVEAFIDIPDDEVQALFAPRTVRTASSVRPSPAPVAEGDVLNCHQCGKPFERLADGVNVHLDEDGATDHEADGDHTAYALEGGS